MHPTVEDIKRVVVYLKKHAIKPGRIETQEQADRQNEHDRALGLPFRWKVGDEFYELSNIQYAAR